MNNDLLNVALSRLSFLRYEEKISLQKKLDNVARLALLSIEELSELVGRRLKTSLWPIAHLERRIERDMHIMQMYKMQFCTSENAVYPQLLKELYDPPFMLFWRGNIDVLQNQTVSVVGTRRPTGVGMQTTFTFAKELAYEGITTVSGLAIGVDSYVHKGSLTASSQGATGSTCAVLASSVDIITPQLHKALASDVIEQGCLLSEYPPETDAQKWQFPQRNRIVSGLTPITTIMEAPSGSGALITADFALEQGRELVFHQIALNYPDTPKPKKRSVRQYMEEGAQVIKNAKDIAVLLSELHFENNRND